MINGSLATFRSPSGALSTTASEAARIPATIIDKWQECFYTYQASVFATIRDKAAPQFEGEQLWRNPYNR
jgi:hypothetical protein